MKNNFLKKLAYTMAAAVIVTSIGANGTGAATTPAMTKNAKTIYVNGGNGISEKTYTLKLKNKPSGSTNKWSTSNASVATVTGGKVTAVSAGKATITVKNKTKAGKTKSYTCKVTVKENAKELKINNIPENNLIGIGQEVHQFNSTLTTISGGKGTDKVSWTITNDTAGATVKDGKISTTKAGEFTLTASAYQSEGLLKKGITSASDSVTIKVGSSIREVAQKAIRKIAVTFDTDMSKVLTKDKIALTNASTKVKQAISDITFSADGKVATIQTYLDLADKTEYTITYGDQAKNFIASKGDPANVTVSGKTVQYGTGVAFDIGVLDNNQVDITTDSMLKDNMTFKYDTSKANITWNSTDKKWEITIFNYNQSVEVTAIYHTYQYKNGEEITIENKGTFHSVKELKDSSSDLAYTIAPSTPDWNNKNETIPQESTYKIFVKGKNQQGKAITQADCEFESTDTNLVTVSKNGTAVNVYGVRAGKTYIRCSYGSTELLIPVTVGEKSVVETITADKTGDTLYRRGVDSTTIKFTLKDKFGIEKSITDTYRTEVKPLNASANDVIQVASRLDQDGEVEFTLKDKTSTSGRTGTYNYIVTAYDKSMNIAITVEQLDSSTISYIQLEASATTIDPVVKENKDKKVTFKTYSYNSKGQRIAPVNANFTVKLGDTEVPTNKSISSKAYCNIVNNSLEFYGLKTNAVSGAAIQASDGTYTIKASYKVDNSNTKETSAILKVKSTQSKPSVTITTTQLEGTRTIRELITDVMKFTLDGSSVDIREITPVSVNAVVDSINKSATLSTFVNKNVYINTITIQYNAKDNNGNNVLLQQTIDIDKTFLVK